MEKGTGKENFKRVIKAYLDQRANEDELFAKTYAKENKNIDDCISYILSVVKTLKLEVASDEEIFSMAVHYYDEDDLTIEDMRGTFVNITSGEKIELTEEEKQEARREAIRKYTEAQIAELRKRPIEKVKPKKENPQAQQSLFDL